MNKNGVFKAFSVCLALGMLGLAMLEAQGCDRGPQDQAEAIHPVETPQPQEAVAPKPASANVAKSPVARDAGASDGGDAGAWRDVIENEREFMPATKAGPVFRPQAAPPVQQAQEPK